MYINNDMFLRITHMIIQFLQDCSVNTTEFKVKFQNVLNGSDKQVVRFFGNNPE